MNNQELIEEVNNAWILSDDGSRLIKKDYDIIPTEQAFAVKLKTGTYTILRKSEKFDDEVLEKSENYENTLQMLQRLTKRKPDL